MTMMGWVGLFRRRFCTAIWALAMEAKGPSVFWELGAGRVPLQESLPSTATKKFAVTRRVGWPTLPAPAHTVGIAKKLMTRNATDSNQAIRTFRFDASRQLNIAFPRIG